MVLLRLPCPRGTASVAGSRWARDRDDVQPLVELSFPAAVEAVWGALAQGAWARAVPPRTRALPAARGATPRGPLMRPFDARKREPRLEQLMLMRAQHHQPIVLDAPAALWRLLRRRLQIVPCGPLRRPRHTAHSIVFASNFRVEGAFARDRGRCEPACSPRPPSLTRRYGW
jgi:hypothetical protein